MAWQGRLEIWHIVLASVLSGQVLKMLVYSIVQRRLQIAVLGQSAGLPSVHALVGASLLTACILRRGWDSPEASVAFVFLVITVFDAMRVRAAAQRQRRLLHELVHLADEAAAWRRRAASYLDLIVHTPFHVAVGLIWGFLFAMALGTV